MYIYIFAFLAIQILCDIFHNFNNITVHKYSPILNLIDKLQ